ncbi:M28 family peptidase [Nocardioides sp.]|uniref:M28 family peptidase n=1 Tax=Nocardioides sp. TaxID=35761 RepID=UPI003568D6A3
MKHPSTTHARWLSGIALLASAATVAAGVPAVAATTPGATTPSTTVAEHGTTKPGGLAGKVKVREVMKHLARFDAIGDRHGDRSAGTPGYRVSRNYVVKRLQRAGYKPQVQAFDFAYFAQLAPSVFEQTSPTPTTYEEDSDNGYALMTYSGSGDVTAPVQPVDLSLGDPAASTSGCEAADFEGFTAGNIALIQRGACAFADKVVNAQDAGATGVIVMNQGTPGRFDAFSGTLSNPVGTVPAIGTTFAIGESLASGEAEVHLAASTESDIRETWNVLAETKGQRRNTVMAGAHLDSVQGANGVNDNGSGSGALLAVAEKLAEQKRKPTNRVRFAWWGAEELGLKGSRHYVDDLATNRPRRFQQIALYLNFDMVASPNYALMVYDGDNSAYPVGPGAAEGPEGSGAIERMFHRFFDRLGTGSDESAFSGRSDYGPFIELNVPAGGLFTGAEGIKTEEQAVQFGGTAGEAYDPCYHAACDDMTNLSRRALRANTAAIAHMVARFARSTRAVNGDSTGHEPPAEPRHAHAHPRHQHRHAEDPVKR